MAAPSHAPLRKVTLNAARSKEFPDGSIRHGYDFVAPLTSDGHIDLEAWKQHRGECFAHRFWGNEPALRGPCCVQWPQPGSVMVFVKLGTNRLRLAIN